MSNTIHSSEYQMIIEKLKEVRINTGLSQQDVAEKLGKPQSFVSKIESCERRLDVAELKLFAKIYDKEISYFFNIEN